MPIQRNPLHITIAAIAFLALIQLVPVNRNNPPVTGEIDPPDNVYEIIYRACYDCHSNETDWPWYSRIAPVSWWLAHNVSEGREHLNFSIWDSYTPAEQLHLVEEIWEEVDEANMPLYTYLITHPRAELSNLDINLIYYWRESFVMSATIQEHSEKQERLAEEEKRGSGEEGTEAP